jgi:predicted phosphate transport protein (TIGR00153 family)
LSVTILDLFAKSPIKPLQEHMHAVVECVGQVTPLFEALCLGDRESIIQAHRSIDELESKADRLKNDLRAHLPRRLLLPVDRRDLLEILDLQDTIADQAEDIAELLVERPMPVPETMRRALLDLVRAVERTCLGACEVIDTLDELVEIGFRGREANRVERMIDELGALETDTDRLEVELMRELFKLEETLSPVSVMLWYQLIQWIGNLADNAEKVGNRLRLLIAR